MDPATARRRGTPVPTGLRRRITSPATSSTHSNPNLASAGNYGYGSKGAMNSNFPGGYSKASYGYVGAKAHRGSADKKLMMKAAAVGVVGGMAGYYLASRWGHRGWGWRSRRCQQYSANDQTGRDVSCSDCYQENDVRCETAETQDAARDDLMSTGFIPHDFVSPINISIYKVESEEFASGVCPPNDWDGDLSGDRRLSSWTPKDPQPDLYLTISTMFELEEKLEDNMGLAGNAAICGPSAMLLTCIIIFGLRRLW